MPVEVEAPILVVPITVGEEVTVEVIIWVVVVVNVEVPVLVVPVTAGEEVTVEVIIWVVVVVNVEVPVPVPDTPDKVVTVKVEVVSLTTTYCNVPVAEAT